VLMKWVSETTWAA